MATANVARSNDQRPERSVRSQRLAALVLGLSATASTGCAADASVGALSPYDPLAAFTPLALPEPINRYRSANGAPGPDHWQNRADYLIDARLDPVTKTLSGEVVIT